MRSLTLGEPAAYWILARLGERLDEFEQSNGFVHAVFAREVSEDELANFLRLGGLAEPGEDVQSHPNWSRWVEHRATLSWLSPLLDHPERSIDDLARIAPPALVTKGTSSMLVDRRLVDVLGQRLPNARVMEFEGDHAHHIEQIDAFLDGPERHLTSSRRALEHQHLTDDHAVGSRIGVLMDAADRPRRCPLDSMVATAHLQ